MNLGDFKIHSVSDGFFRLDGGAMFGVVPRILWEKTNPPDDQNRIRLGLNPLLIQAEGINVLVDTGIGGKGNEKFCSMYAIERKPTLQESIYKLGLKEEDISIVINTHLHFDHAGGNTVHAYGILRPTFTKAKYIVQKGEWDDAVKPNERTKSSYRSENFFPVMDAGQFELIEGDKEIIKGVSVIKTAGHNRHIQLVKIESKGKVAIFLADIIPTRSHLSYPFIMGFDLFPLETLKVKKEIIREAVKDKWLLIFEHDPEVRMGYVRIKDNKPILKSL